MTLTIEVSVQSVEQYLQVLAVLDQAEENGELGFEVAARPSECSLAILAADAVSRLRVP